MPPPLPEDAIPLPDAAEAESTAGLAAAGFISPLPEVEISLPDTDGTAPYPGLTAARVGFSSPKP
jgi:hypothetical protein